MLNNNKIKKIYIWNKKRKINFSGQKNITFDKENYLLSEKCLEEKTQKNQWIHIQ